MAIKAKLIEQLELKGIEFDSKLKSEDLLDLLLESDRINDSIESEKSYNFHSDEIQTIGEEDVKVSNFAEFLKHPSFKDTSTISGLTKEDIQLLLSEIDALPSFPQTPTEIARHYKETLSEFRAIVKDFQERQKEIGMCRGLIRVFRNIESVIAQDQNIKHA